MTPRHLLGAAVVVALAASATAQDRVTGANWPQAQKFDRAFVVLPLVVDRSKQLVLH